MNSSILPRFQAACCSFNNFRTAVSSFPWLKETLVVINKNKRNNCFIQFRFLFNVQISGNFLLMIAIIRVRMIMYTAGTIINKMGQDDEGNRWNKNPCFILVKDLFENQEGKPGGENQQ